jgi:Transposase DDE domain
LTRWLAAPTGKRGRPPIFIDAAIQACLTLKALFGLPLRQTTGLVASLLDLAGLDWPAPDFSTLCRRQKTLAVHIPYRPGTGALHLLIDSTGVKAEGDGDWLAKEHGPSRSPAAGSVMRPDCLTRWIRSLAISPSAWSRPTAPMTPVPATPPSRRRSGHTAPQERQAMEGTNRRDGGAQRGAPQLPPPRPGDLEALDRLSPTTSGRGQDTLAGSLEPVALNLLDFKLLGERVMARDFERQVAELQIRAAILNRFTAHGTPLTQRTA